MCARQTLMLGHWFTVICQLLVLDLLGTSGLGQNPEQIHLSIGETSTTVVVTWVTHTHTPESIVNYTTDDQWNYAYGTEDVFVDGGDEKRALFIHRVHLENLSPNQIYNYSCGCCNNWSKNFSFRVLPDHPFWSPRLAVLGDMGITNNVALPELVREVTKMDSVDMVMHVGDFAYNMDTDNGRYGDTFMQQIEDVAARVPYMTAVGNHELAYNFSHYKARFTMPGGDGESQFYSFDLGPAHIISFSSEFYYYLYYGWKQVVRQYEWLRQDLKRANQPFNRLTRPWIIAMAHRPMYCSNSNDPMHCDTVDNLVRTGFPYSDQGVNGYSCGLEALFYQYGVDLIIGAHEHSYERFWPVYNRTVCNGTLDNPYLNPPAPVHIVTGSAGCSEGVDPFVPGGKPWSAFRSDDYGFTRIDIHNSTHLSIKQLSVDKGYPAQTIDSFTIIKEKHGRDQFNCPRKLEEVPFIKLEPAHSVRWGL